MRRFRRFCHDVVLKQPDAEFKVILKNTQLRRKKILDYKHAAVSMCLTGKYHFYSKKDNNEKFALRRVQVD